MHKDYYSTDVYVIHTPYHLLASILLADSSSTSFFIFISADLERWSRYLPFLRATYGEKCFIILPQWPNWSLARLTFGRIGNGTKEYRKLAHNFRYMTPDLYIFNDSDVEAQLLVTMLAPQRITHVEDGSFSYVSFYLSRRWFTEFIKTATSCGNYHSKKVIGASRHICRRLAIFPERVRRELQPADLLEIRESGLARLRALALSLGADLPSGNLAIVTVPLEELDHNEKDWYLAMIDQCRAEGLTVCVKEHPRQRGSSELSLYADFTLNPFLPVELLAIHSDRVKIIIGAANTSSIVLSALSPNTRIIALLKGLWADDAFAVETLQISGAEIWNAMGDKLS